MRRDFSFSVLLVVAFLLKCEIALDVIGYNLDWESYREIPKWKIRQLGRIRHENLDPSKILTDPEAIEKNNREVLALIIGATEAVIGRTPPDTSEIVSILEEYEEELGLDQRSLTRIGRSRGLSQRALDRLARIRTLRQAFIQNGQNPSKTFNQEITFVDAEGNVLEGEPVRLNQKGVFNHKLLH